MDKETKCNNNLKDIILNFICIYKNHYINLTRSETSIMSKENLMAFLLICVLKVKNAPLLEKNANLSQNFLRAFTLLTINRLVDFIVVQI